MAVLSRSRVAFSKSALVTCWMPSACPLFIASENSEFCSCLSMKVETEIPRTPAHCSLVNPCAMYRLTLSMTSSVISNLGLPTGLFDFARGIC